MPPYCLVSAIAGDGTAATLDGSGLSARFNRPHGLALQGGALLVLDNNGNRVRTVSGSGVVATLAGGAQGFADGTGTSALFNWPSSIVPRGDGSFLIADLGNFRIRAMTAAGVVTTLAGSGVAGATDAASATAATFRAPKGLALSASSSGPLYISDTTACNVRALSTVSGAGGAVTTYAGSGTCGNADAVGTNAQFDNPYGLAVASDGAVWVADLNNHRVRRITPGATGSYVTQGAVAHLAGSTSKAAGSVDGTGAAATFNGPMAIVFDPTSTVGLAFVSEYSKIRTLSPAGVVGTLAGAGAAGSGNGACLLLASFENPNAIVADPEGNLYTTEWNTNQVRKVTRFTPTPSAQASPTASSTGSATQSPAGSATASPSSLATATASSTGSKSFVVSAPPTASPTISPTATVPPYCLVSAIAGDGTAATLDGSGLSARFNRPHGLALQGGALLVLDNNGNRVRTVSGSGVVATLAGGAQGFADGTGTSALFNWPSSIVPRGDGSFLIADLGNFRIRAMTAAGVVTTLAGSGVAGATDAASATAATFRAPKGLALSASSSGPLYISDTTACNVRALSTVSGAGGAVTTYAGSGTCGNADAVGTNAQFDNPYGLAVASDGAVWVADLNNHRVRRITPGATGSYVTQGAVAHLAGSTSKAAGSVDGTGAAATFNGPMAIVFDPTSTVGLAFVSEYSKIRTLSPAGVVGTLAGAGAAGSGNGACLLLASFENPNAIVADPEGNLYTTEWNTNQVRKVTRFTPTPSAQASPTASSTGSATQSPAGSSSATVSPSAAAPPYCVVSTFAGTGTLGVVDGSRLSAQFKSPRGAAFSGATLYVTDSAGNTVRAISPAGVVTTVAGSSASAAAFVDATGASARFSYPSALVARHDGVLLIPDAGNNRIRAMTPAGAVTTLAGAGGTGAADSAAPLSATFNSPKSLALSAAITQPLYIGDIVNCNVRAMATATGGAITTYAGSAAGATCGNVDATGTNARFAAPYGLAVSPLDGSLWVADSTNHRIRRVAPSAGGSYVTQGAVAHLAGSTTGAAGFLDGVGSAAAFSSPFVLMFDPASPAGLAFVVENSKVRTLTPAGVVGTLAANANGAAGAGNGACLWQASFSGALGVDADPEGNLYIADFDNNQVRKVTRFTPSPSPQPSPTASSTGTTSSTGTASSSRTA